MARTLSLFRSSARAPAATSSSPACRATGRVRFADPDGAFYLFFSVDGETTPASSALRLVDEANVGVAPGSAFGAAGEGFMRLCFARDAGQVREATERLAKWVTSR